MKQSTKSLLYVLALLLVGGCVWSGIVGCHSQWQSMTANDHRGTDLLESFARAHRGAPLRFVAIGGSITQGDHEAWIGGWLREQFPKSHVTVVNSGMSATGSELGIYRMERDIIAHQPDVVAIEYCVNDGGLSDEDAIRYMETIVVRLKKLPHPPAILIVEAAARGGVKLARHRKVAEHYGLFEVDLQAAVDDYLKKNDKPWETFFKDDVHPSEAGNAFYSSVLVDKLKPLVSLAQNIHPSTKEIPFQFPSPLSKKPLLLDAHLTTLGEAPGWKKESAPTSWWNRFFMGTLTASEPGTVYTLPFRGTSIGLYYALEKDALGSFYASVDGGVPEQVLLNQRGGYSFTVFEKDLPPGEHVLTLVLPAKEQPFSQVKSNGPVKLGFAMISGDSISDRTPVPQGSYSSDILRSLTFLPVQAKAFEWSGMFPVDEKKRDTASELNTIYPPENPPEASVKLWTPLTGEESLIDFAKISNSTAPGVAYLRTTVKRAEGGNAFLRLTVDYHAKVWINGEVAANLQSRRGSGATPLFFPVKLKKGENQILVKVVAGSRGFNASVAFSGEGQVP